MLCIWVITFKRNLKLHGTVLVYLSTIKTLSTYFLPFMSLEASVVHVTGGVSVVLYILLINM